MSDEFESDPAFNDFPSKPVPAREFTVIMRLADLVEIVIKVIKVLGVIVILIALFTGPAAYRSAREAARRAQCGNNLKQIALALDNYERVYNALPPAHTVDADGRPLHSWRTLILPYLEQETLYKSIDLAKPWNDPANAKALATSLDVYRCPQWRHSASGGPPLNETSYRAIVGPNNCLDPTQPRRLSDMIDDHGPMLPLTLMVIEVGKENAVPWMAPVDADEAMVMSLGSAANPPHAGGRNACFVDGGVRLLKADTPVKVLRAMMTIAGGEDILPQDW